jgi:uncharacterized protein (TIGR03067 family)
LERVAFDELPCSGCVAAGQWQGGWSLYYIWRIDVKRKGLACAIVLLVLAPSGRCDSPAAGGDGGKAMEGTWLPSSAELGGNRFSQDLLKTIRLVLKDGKYTVTVGEQVDEGTTKVDSTKKPGALEIVGTKGPNKGKTIHAIYELKGDTLRVCYDLSGEGHPTEFKTMADTKLFLVTYRREKH